MGRTTEALVRERVALRPLGEHPLRGLRGRIAVFQVVADGLASEFPVLRSVDYFAGNLPHQLSSLVGREELVGDVADAVRASRLVTLTGVGGVGKTRLALEVGADMAGEFPDGVWIVELAGVGDADDVPDALATTLGITTQGDVPLIDTVADALAGRRMLLVVDNCEHVLERRRRHGGGDPRPGGKRADPGDVARGARRERRGDRDRAAAPGGRRRHLRRGHAVRRSSAGGPPELRAPGPPDGGRRHRDLRRPSTACRSASSWPRRGWPR